MVQISDHAGAASHTCHALPWPCPLVLDNTRIWPHRSAWNGVLQAVAHSPSFILKSSPACAHISSQIFSRRLLLSMLSFRHVLAGPVAHTLVQPGNGRSCGFLLTMSWCARAVCRRLAGEDKSARSTHHQDEEVKFNQKYRYYLSFLLCSFSCPGRCLPLGKLSPSTV